MNTHTHVTYIRTSTADATIMMMTERLLLLVLMLLLLLLMLLLLLLVLLLLLLLLLLVLLVLLLWWLLWLLVKLVVLAMMMIGMLIMPARTSSWSRTAWVVVFAARHFRDQNTALGHRVSVTRCRVGGWSRHRSCNANRHNGRGRRHIRAGRTERGRNVCAMRWCRHRGNWNRAN